MRDRIDRPLDRLADIIAGASPGRLAAVVVAIWAVSVFPAIALRGLHWEEGRIISIALGAMDGHLLVPHVFGERFAERPVLLSLIQAGLGSIIGDITPWVARLPVVLALLAGALLVFHIVRRYASAAAGFVGAACYLASIQIHKKVITAEGDVLLSVLSLLAVWLWWNGTLKERRSPLRWAAIAALVTGVAMVKGPQMAGFFGVGIGLAILVGRHWRDLPGYVAVGVVSLGAVVAWYLLVFQSGAGDVDMWVRHSRFVAPPSIDEYLTARIVFLLVLAGEMMPALLLAVPFWWCTLRRHRDDPTAAFGMAIFCYAVPVTLLLAPWPGSDTRYAMCAFPAVAIAAGLGFERFRHLARLRRVVLSIVVVLLGFRVLYGWVAMPALSELFDRSRQDALVVQAAIDADPAPISFVWIREDYNIMVQVDAEIRSRPLDAFGDPALTGWFLLPVDVLQQVATARGLERLPEPRAHVGGDSHLALIRIPDQGS